MKNWGGNNRKKPCPNNRDKFYDEQLAAAVKDHKTAAVVTRAWILFFVWVVYSHN